jgi:hypothetical protein
MNRSLLSLLALAANLSWGAEISTLGAQSKNPPPPIYIAQTPAAKPSAPEPNAVAPAPPPSAPAQSGSNNLEKLAKPIALHPDPLIASILPAAAYPLEIVQAARFVKDTNNISKVDEQPWDENVKAVAKFPALIAKMDGELEWTMALGQAFIDQPKELMDTIQSLRAKAQKAGTLRSSPQQVVTVTNVVIVQTNLSQVVTVTNQIVQVQPSNPQVVYVPSYPPTVYYPPPAYVYDPIAPLVTFGVGMAWGAVLANNCNWNHGEVDIDIDHNVNVNRPDRPAGQSGNRASGTGAKAGTQKWQPDQSRLRSSGAPASAQTRDARGWGGSPQSTQRPAGGAGGARPSTQPSPSGQRAGTAARPTTSQAGARPAGAGSQPAANRSTPSAGTGARSSPSPSANRSGSSSAFSGVKSGRSEQNFSSRGASSRGGGGARGGGGGRR